MAAIILAGGRSTRLGRDKAGEVLLGRTLLQRAVDAFAGLVDESVIVRAAGQSLPPTEVRGRVSVVEDLYPETGPLGGIFTGLSAIEGDCAVVVACDMPLLQPALLAELLRLSPEADLVVPLRDGLPEPLCAAYSKACLTPIRERLERGEYKVTGFFEALTPHYLQPQEWQRFDPDGLSFLNVNREEDLVRARELLEARQAPH
jgi:molybdopterin-guanine dinucleotide biosynthesis protein A